MKHAVSHQQTLVLAGFHPIAVTSFCQVRPDLDFHISDRLSCRPYSEITVYSAIFADKFATTRLFSRFASNLRP